MRAAQKGDTLAMSALLDGVSPYVGRICGPIALEDGEDAAQEALIAVVRRLGTLREPRALWSWIRVIATREAVRAARRRPAVVPSADAPNAVPDYVLPGASIGYQPGYGEAFRSTPGSANGNPVTFEVVITCAERSNYAICAYAVGPQVDLARIVPHPTPSKLALSLWSDPDLNGVRWKGQTLP